MNELNEDVKSLTVKLSSINFENRIELFKEWTVEYFFKRYKVFNKVCWKDVIQYSIYSRYYEHYKLGKLFKESINGIYDFIHSGFSFGGLLCSSDVYLTKGTEHGILLLKINGEIIHIYYKIETGACPTCGMSEGIYYPPAVQLFIADSIEDIVSNCMTLRNRKTVNYYLRF